MKIVKAEILWSRTCSLRCKYCAMVDGRLNSFPLKRWIIGLDNLKELGCGFIAFYGAEPLLEFEKLVPVVRRTADLGIESTVITSGVVPNLKEKLHFLWENGLRSLSVSYDIAPYDISSESKKKKAIETLESFRSFGECRDVACIATVGKRNLTLIPEIVKELTDKHIWTFFDVLHYDRGQPGTKCAAKEALKDELFDESDLPVVQEVFSKLLELKNKGLLLHNSKNFLQLVIDNPNAIREQNWNCANLEAFPAFVTVDVDGAVLPCDDFHSRTNIPPICIDQINERFDEFSKFWKQRVLKSCPGCLWNTHLDAYWIKEGAIPFSDYIHT